VSGAYSREKLELFSLYHPYVEENLSVMSVGFLLNGPDDAVIWRGPKKMVCRMIKQFLCDVQWGEIDYLIVDTPPGTSDEHLSIEISLQDVKLPIIGVVENMSGFVCPKCKVRLSKNTLTRLNLYVELLITLIHKRAFAFASELSCHFQHMKVQTGSIVEWGVATLLP
uniref:Uncharacterized protein n=1 Tax=Terrapene triunguis TaxID=2587831 RepID=A0A674KDS8_9SAUR